MITIAWDVDDVLNELMLHWFEKKWLHEHQECTLTYDGIQENPPHRLLGISKEKYLMSLDEFRLSDYFKEIPPVSETKKWFLRYGNICRHLVVTAAPMNAAHVSAEWVLQHYGTWIRTFHFIPSSRKGQRMPWYDRSKRDFLKWLGKVDIFIDDNETGVSESEKIGIKGILFPRPWNRSKLTINETLKILTKEIND